jgi:hypothetical protein
MPKTPAECARTEKALSVIHCLNREESMAERMSVRTLAVCHGRQHTAAQLEGRSE